MLFCTGSFSSAAETLFAALFVSYALSARLPAYMLTVAAAVFLLPVALMPLIYHGISRIRNISMGKFHGTFIVVTVLAAVGTAVLWNIFPHYSQGLKISMLLISLFLCTHCFMTYHYLCFSIGSKLGASVESKGFNLSSVFAFLGAAVFVILFWLFKDVGGYSDMGYLTAVVILVTGFAVYFATFSSIPRLTSPKPPRRVGFSSVYKRFYGLFMNRRNVYVLTGYLFIVVALMLFAFSGIQFVTGTFAMSLNITAGVLTTFAAATAAGYMIIKDGVRGASYRTLMGVTAAAAALVVASLVPFVLKSYLVFSAALDYVSVFCAAGVAGIAVAMLASVSKRFFADIVEREEVSEGRMLNLRNIAASVGIGVALALTGGTLMIGRFYNLIVCGAAAVFIVLAFVMYQLRGEYHD